MLTLYVAWHVAAFAIGAALGSFLALAVVRIPEDASVISPPSHCPVCETELAWYDNIPVLSWLILRARCRTCDAPIPPLYPLLELTSGLVSWLLFRRFVPSAAQLDLAHLAAWGVYLVFAWMLLLAAYTDLRARIIPDGTSLYAVPVGVAGAWLLEVLAYHGWMAIGWRQAVVGAAVSGGFLLLTSLTWDLVFGKVGLALGDVKLMAMIGAFVGLVPGAIVVLLVASILGSLLGVVVSLATRRMGYLPFGPALALGGIGYVLFGDTFVAHALPGMSGLIPGLGLQ